MYQLDNPTVWSAGLYPGWNSQGQRQFTFVLKAGFTLAADGRLAPLPHPTIEEADRYRGDPKRSSLEAACEIVPFKKGGELLLSGTAYPPQKGSTVTEVEVGIRLSDGRTWTKTLRVFGQRCWTTKLLMTIPGSPAPLDPTPLTYENAYGGFDQRNPEDFYGANPAGKGYSQRGLWIKDLELPQIEIGPRFISSPMQRPAPAGFGPISPLWEPRLKVFAGLDLRPTEDGGCPWGEAGVPPNLHNTAPTDQRFEKPFAGGETLTLRGFIPESPKDMAVQIPKLRPDVSLVIGNQMTGKIDTSLDTIVVDTDRKHLGLIFRGTLPWVADVKEKRWVFVHDPDEVNPASEA